MSNGIHTAPRVRRAAAGLGALALAGLSIHATAPFAHADESTPSGCVAAGKVWLLVVTPDGGRMADTCVGTPSSGTAALRAGGITVDDAAGHIARLNGFPEVDEFKKNHYWTYYHLRPGGSWQYSTKGADAYAPPAGTVEGWCYTGSSGNCAMPALTVAVPAAAKPSASASSTKPIAKATTATTRATIPAKRSRTGVAVPATTKVAGASAPASGSAKASAGTSTSSSASASPTPTASPSASASASASLSPSATPSVSTSATPSASASPATSVTPTETATPVAVPTTTPATPASGGNGPLATIATLVAAAAAGGGYLWWKKSKGTPS